MTPLLSIIIPVYNVETFLRECVDSIIAQKFTDWELILVDDGSPDSSGDICNQYAAQDTRIKVVHQSNAGVSNARNRGLSEASGKWITFIDSDDWIAPDFLQSFNLDEHDDADMVVQGLQYYDHVKGLVKRSRIFSASEITRPDIEGTIATTDLLAFGVTVCKCIKKELIDKNNISFNNEIDYHEDHLFTLSVISHCKKIITTSSCGYFYRCGHNPSSLSKKKHPWKKMVLSSQYMMSVLSEISQRFNLSKAYFCKTATFCLGPKLVAINTIYSSDISSKERKRLLKENLTPIADFQNYYKSPSRRYKLLPVICRLNSTTLLHWFFTCLSKI